MPSEFRDHAERTPPLDREARLQRLAAELRVALERVGASDRTVASVLASGCRLDGVGAGALGAQLADADVRLRARVRALAAAMDRAAAGEGDRCEACGEPIDAARLDLIPTTTRCRHCAR